MFEGWTPASGPRSFTLLVFSSDLIFCAASSHLIMFRPRGRSRAPSPAASSECTRTRRPLSAHTVRQLAALKGIKLSKTNSNERYGTPLRFLFFLSRCLPELQTSTRHRVWLKRQAWCDSTGMCVSQHSLPLHCWAVVLAERRDTFTHNELQPSCD